MLISNHGIQDVLSFFQQALCFKSKFITAEIALLFSQSDSEEEFEGFGDVEEEHDKKPQVWHFFFQKIKQDFVLLESKHRFVFISRRWTQTGTVMLTQDSILTMTRLFHQRGGAF